MIATARFCRALRWYSGARTPPGTRTSAKGDFWFCSLMEAWRTVAGDTATASAARPGQSREEETGKHYEPEHASVYRTLYKTLYCMPDDSHPHVPDLLSYSKKAP